MFYRSTLCTVQYAALIYSIYHWTVSVAPGRSCTPSLHFAPSSPTYTSSNKNLQRNFFKESNTGIDLGTIPLFLVGTSNQVGRVEIKLKCLLRERLSIRRNSSRVDVFENSEIPLFLREDDINSRSKARFLEAFPPELGAALQNYRSK